MRSNEEIVDVIQLLMKEKGISLSELSRRTKVTKSSLSRYFHKTRKFPLTKVSDFARELGTTDEYILGFSIEENDSQNVLKNHIVDLSAEELKEVILFIEFLKSKR